MYSSASFSPQYRLPVLSLYKLGPYLTGGKSGVEAPAGPSIATGPSAVGTAGAVGTVAVSPGANQTPQSSLPQPISN